MVDRLFVYSPLIEEVLAEFANHDALAKQIEDEILKNPEAGDIVQGTGGIRKMRLADPGRNKGKRGGLRVFFLDLPDKERTHLIFLLRKGDADDISPDEKQVLKELVVRIKKESSK
ncbi:MAG: type II toxin-antitoxin system RelE/ParE family toxin [Deltaproteobacteria bacterium]|jgi:hypothetical protein|nr:type II toxin-antitoxin system RelE/ParE family toxin [Deltaproteobacteria bacterium]